MTQHAVFLSYNSVDQLAVEEIAKRLRAADIEPWLDAWQVAAGDKWQQALEKALTETRASLVFIGPSGVGPWQEEEMRVAIDRRVREVGYRVIPVLLPGALRGKRSAVPAFLASVRWVEFQRNLDEEPPFRSLFAGIEGKPPAPSPSTVAGSNPYRGLQVFDVADSGLFFGREVLTDWLRNDLRSSIASRGTSRLLAIVGASGSGKSSLARAGLLAQLAAGAIAGSEHWPQILLKPGADPLAALAIAGADALALGTDDQAVLAFQDRLLSEPRSLHTRASLALRGKPPGTQLLLLVDQFEEIFTLCSSETHRQYFIDNLLHAASVTDGPTVVVLTLRADFLGKCAAHPQLAAVLSGSQELVGPMSRDELREAIERPAWQAGCEFQPGLVDVLLDDVEAQPGGLPLLQHALYELWRKADGRRLTHAAYKRLGGVRGALAGRADEVYRHFTPAEQALTRRILLRLTQPGEGTEDTRRRTLRAEIIPTDAARETVERIVRTLADERLLVTEGDSVDVAHEALIRSWPTLREWLDQDREGLREHRRLTLAAEEWQRLAHDESVLYRGLRLDRALAWREKDEEALNALEGKFLDAGIRLRDAEEEGKRTQEKEREEQRQRELAQAHRLAEEAEGRRAAEGLRATQQRKLTRIASLAALVAVILGLAGGGFWWRSETQRDVAEAGRLASESQLERDQRFGLSLLLANAATQIAVTKEARSSLLAGIQSHPHLGAFLGGHTKEVYHVAFSPDGKTLASTDADGTLILWDVATRKPLGEPLAGHNDEVFSIAFSPDGKILALANGDGYVTLWDVATRRPLGEPLHVESAEANSIAFSPDGKVLASADHTSVILWDVAQRKPLGELLGDDHMGEPGQVVFGPDGKILALANGDGYVTLWDVATRRPLGEPLHVESAEANSIAFSPDGKVLASADHTSVILWDVAARQPLDEEPLINHQDRVTEVAFSPDGKILASASRDGTVVLWDVAARQPLGEPLRGHRGVVHSIAFSPDGKTLASASDDNTVILWDVALRTPLSERLAGHESWVTSVAFSPDGKTLASASDDNTVILWDVALRTPLSERLAGHESWVTSVAFSPDGKTLASASADNSVILWNVAQRKTQGEPLRAHKAGVTSVAFSPDGKTLASGSEDYTVILWDVAARKPLGEPLRGDHRDVFGVAFSPDGKTLASATRDNVILWDVAQRKPLGEPLASHKRWVRSVAFSPDGKTLASGSEDDTVILWDVVTHKPLGEPLRGHEGWVTSVAFSPDGKTLASGSFLWDAATHKPLGDLRRGDEASTRNIAFSPDGKTLGSSYGPAVILWDVALESWQSRACETANRNLSCDEWHNFMSERPYWKVCDKLPAPDPKCS